jgi:hypothetical protein
MTVTVAPLESGVFTVLGQFLEQTLPGGVEVVQGQDNYVPPPNATDYVVMWPIRRSRLSTNHVEYDPAVEAAGRAISAPTDAVIQLDFHGVNCADNTQIFTTLFRDPFATGFFEGSGYTPLYCDDGQQLPFLTGEKQFENRWVLYAHLQATPTVSTTQQFADNLDTVLIEVDTTYPPTGA